MLIPQELQLSRLKRIKDQRNNLRDFMTQFENLGELKLPKSFH